MLNEDINSRNVNLDSYKERITNFSQEFELGLFIFILKRSLIWIVLCVLTAIASAFIYLRYTAPTVRNTRSILQVRESNTAKKILSMEHLHGGQEPTGGCGVDAVHLLHGPRHWIETWTLP
jgi:hypothetical protein